MSQLRTWTPAQVAALVFGVWWIGNGIVVFLAEPSGATLDTSSSVDTAGLSIAVNGWHGLFHLASGVAGVSLCWGPRRARAYSLIAGAIYLAAALWSLFTTGTIFGVIRVDELGSADHAVEAVLLVSAWFVSRPQPRPDDRTGGHPTRA